jgi:hypothetical protein
MNSARLVEEEYLKSLWAQNPTLVKPVANRYIYYVFQVPSCYYYYYYYYYTITIAINTINITIIIIIIITIIIILLLL